MGWKGTLRSINAASRAASRASERAARQRQRELGKQRKELAKMQELQKAQYEVMVYENRISILMSVHQDCRDQILWKDIIFILPPEKPVRSDQCEKKARKKLKSFKPNLFHKIFKNEEAKRIKLSNKIEDAIRKDEIMYQNILNEYSKEYSQWKDEHDMASSIIDGDPEAYIEAINQLNPFEEISNIGSAINFEVVNKSVIDVTLNVNSDEVIPKEAKSLLKSGKLAVKNMPKGQFHELYQDYVCSCVLRVARELFAILPISGVIVTAEGNLLNTQTGHLEDQPILSVYIPQKTLNILNFDMIDPSDSMTNFIHNMNFKKTKGFSLVEKIKISDLNAMGD